MLWYSKAPASAPADFSSCSHMLDLSMATADVAIRVQIIALAAGVCCLFSLSNCGHQPMRRKLRRELRAWFQFFFCPTDWDRDLLVFDFSLFLILLSTQKIRKTSPKNCKYGFISPEKNTFTVKSITFFFFFLNFPLFSLSMENWTCTPNILYEQHIEYSMYDLGSTIT